MEMIRAIDAFETQQHQERGRNDSKDELGNAKPETRTDVPSKPEVEREGDDDEHGDGASESAKVTESNSTDARNVRPSGVPWTDARDVSVDFV